MHPHRVIAEKTPFAYISTCREYTKPHAAHTDRDANQSVQDGREGEAEDVVEDGEGGEFNACKIERRLLNENSYQPI